MGDAWGSWDLAEGSLDLGMGESSFCYNKVPVTMDAEENATCLRA